MFSLSLAIEARGMPTSQTCEGIDLSATLKFSSAETRDLFMCQTMAEMMSEHLGQHLDFDCNAALFKTQPEVRLAWLGDNLRRFGYGHLNATKKEWIHDDSAIGQPKISVRWN